MNAPAKITPTALANAFAASGMITAKLNALERHSRELLIAPLEEALAAAWRADIIPEMRPLDPAIVARMDEMRRAAHESAQHKALVAKAARRARVMAALQECPLPRSELEDIACLAHSTTTRFLNEMCNEGLIVMTPVTGQRRNFVYEVAQ